MFFLALAGSSFFSILDFLALPACLPVEKKVAGCFVEGRSEVDVGLEAVGKGEREC